MNHPKHSCRKCDDQATLDEKLSRLDPAKLTVISGSEPAVGANPPFYNCFMNQFVNSPNFQKRLARKSSE